MTLRGSFLHVFLQLRSNFEVIFITTYPFKTSVHTAGLQ